MKAATLMSSYVLIVTWVCSFLSVTHILFSYLKFKGVRLFANNFKILVYDIMIDESAIWNYKWKNLIYSVWIVNRFFNGHLNREL